MWRVPWAAALLVVGALALSSAWSGWQPAVVLVACALLPFGVVAAGRRLRLPGVVPVLTLLGLAALGMYVATASSGAGLVSSVNDAVPRLLTAPRPAPATPDLIAPGALLCLLAGAWSAVRTLTERSSKVAPVLGASVLYLAGALLTAGAADGHLLLAGALVAISVTGWLVMDRPGPQLASAAGNAVPAAIGAVGVAMLVALVPAGAAFEPRKLVDPPQLVLADPSPLSRIAAWQLAEDEELFRVRNFAAETARGAGQTPTRLRLVTLTRYTGASWFADGTYRQLGTVTPTGLPPGRLRTVGDVQITVTRLNGPWLPAVGVPTSVSLSDAVVDPLSGTVARAGGATPGLRYRITGAADAATRGDVDGAAVPTGAQVADYLATPDLPWEFVDYARDVTRGASTPYEQAVKIERAVRAGRKVDTAAPTGSSYARLGTFLFGSARTGAHLGARAGTAEQFATAFAVLARAVGLPTRVVAGFRMPADGTGVVVGRDATAWAEVYFSDWGWLAFEPTAAAAKDGAADDGADRGRRPEPSASASATSGSSPRPSSSSSAVAIGAGAGATLPYALSVAIGLALLLVPLLLVVLARARRLARQRRAGPRGAWSEVLDLLVLMGQPATASQPATAVAADIAGVVPLAGAVHPDVYVTAVADLASALPAATGPVHPAVYLAAAAERAAFGPAEGPKPHHDVAARYAAHAIRAGAAAVTPWHGRIWWPFNFRILRR